MKNKIIILLLGIILLTSLASSEMWYWTDTNINTANSVVTQHGFFQFEDTSETGVGKEKPIQVLLDYDVLGFPVNLSSGSVDWCNFTIVHIKNNYNEGNFTTTTTTDNQFFNGASATSGEYSYDMKDRDSLIVDMSCHYTDSNSLFEGNVLIGKFTTYFGGYECNACETYSLEELSNAVDNNEQIINEQSVVYENIQTIVGLNFQLWVIISWLIKIAFVITAVGLVFLGVYYMYKFFRDIGDRI